METNKYAGTMFSHCDSTLTDRMLAADRLIRKIEFIQEHADNETIELHSTLFEELDKQIVERCVTPRFKLKHETFSNAIEQLRSLLFHIKHVFREIYTSWVAGNTHFSPVFSECVSEIDKRICQQHELRMILCNMK